MQEEKRIKTESEKELTYRVSYQQLMEFMDRFRVGPELHNSALEHLSWLSERKRICEILDYVEILPNGCALTPYGSDFLILGSNERKRHFKQRLLENNSFRYLWAKICDGRDSFTSEEIAPLVKKHLNVSTKKQAKIYASKLANWVKSVGLASTRYKGRYHILERSVIGRSVKNKEEVQTSLEEPSKDYQSNLYRLNAYISDFLSDEEHEIELFLIEGLLEKIRKEDVWDDIVIDMLEREIHYALEVRKHSAFQLVGKSLRDLREEYLEGLENEEKE